MKPTPILFVDHAPAIGGAENSLLMLLKHLDPLHWQPHLACTEGNLATQAAEAGIFVHKVPLPRLRRSVRFFLDWYRGVKALVTLANKLKAVAIYANTIRAATYVAPTAQFTGRPFIWHMRDFWLSESKPNRLWVDKMGKQILCNAASQIITNSHAVARHLPCQSLIHVVHNGIEFTSFKPAFNNSVSNGFDETNGNAFRKQHNIPHNASLIGMVGRLRPWKGQERFLHMAKRVLVVSPESYFVLVGGDPFEVADNYSHHLQQMVRELNLSDRVIFTGHVTDVRPALSAMDIFVHPGAPEPFGLVNVEAMAMAKPVVAFAHGALPEIVIDNKTGLLVSPDDEVALANAVISLQQDSSHCAIMGNAGRERVERTFCIEQTTQGVEKVLHQIVTIKD